jgi:hypothetical protein
MDRNLHRALVLATLDAARDHAQDSGAVALEALDALGPVAGPDAHRELVWSHDSSTCSITSMFDDAPDPEDALVRDLSGLEAFPWFEVVDLEESRVGDLGPLRALTKVVAIRVQVTDSADLSQLLELPSLGRVAVGGAYSPRQRAVLATLEARGVLVDDDAPDLETLSAPFADPNLKLAVVNHVHGATIPRNVPHFDEYRLDKALLARLLALPVTSADLESLEELDWNEGGLGVHHYAYSQWDGEGDTFSIRTLAGIEHLPRLRQLACYAREIPAAELDALVDRGIVVYETPSPPRRAAVAQASTPLLWAMQLSSLEATDLPRNFGRWSPSERRAYLASLELARGAKQVGSRKTLRWRDDAPEGAAPSPAWPRLVCESGEPVESVAIRDLAGIEVWKSLQAIDAPISLVDSLEPLRGLRQLESLTVTVTPEAELDVLLAMKKIVEVDVRGVVTDGQRAVVDTLERRGVTVRRART